MMEDKRRRRRRRCMKRDKRLDIERREGNIHSINKEKRLHKHVDQLHPRKP
jgi:hypothetical protein